MRRRISEILALILAFSMIVTAPGISALAAETYEDPDEVIFEAEDPEEDSSLEEIVLEAQDEETEEFELTEENDEEPGEQPEDSGTTEKDRLTLMVYLVGSDLERKYFAGTLDMTEILAGIDAALLSDKNTEGNLDIPINVIVETGGVSYNPTMSDARDAAQKAELRATAAKDIKNNESFFTKYDAGLKKLIGEKDLGARTIFDTLSAKSYEGAITGPQDLGEPIDWTKNQRWKLVANPTDFSTAPLTPAKTPVSLTGMSSPSLTEQLMILPMLFPVIYRLSPMKPMARSMT